MDHKSSGKLEKGTGPRDVSASPEPEVSASKTTGSLCLKQGVPYIPNSKCHEAKGEGARRTNAGRLRFGETTLMLGGGIKAETRGWES